MTNYVVDEQFIPFAAVLTVCCVIVIFSYLGTKVTRKCELPGWPLGRLWESATDDDFRTITNVLMGFAIFAQMLLAAQSWLLIWENPFPRTIVLSFYLVHEVLRFAFVIASMWRKVVVAMFIIHLLDMVCVTYPAFAMLNPPSGVVLAWTVTFAWLIFLIEFMLIICALLAETRAMKRVPDTQTKMTSGRMR